uniref:Uncharacterized protein n=1 Tax=Vibrio sp. FF_291 TaxID=1652832 RepID=A0A0H3ZUS8_9VIBR|nr:hypothetical protein [Vibrio sp. FF_291]
MNLNYNEVLEIITNAPTMGDAIVQFYDFVVYGLINEKFEGLNKAVHTLSFAFLSCVIFIQAILSMMGKFEASLKAIALTAVWILVASAISKPETYNHLIVDTINSVIVGLGAFFAGDFDGGTTFTMVDNLFLRLFLLLDQVTDILDWHDVLSWILTMLIGGIFAALYAMFVIIIVFCKFALSLLLLFGGLVIQFSAFKSVRGILKSWLQAIAKYGISIVIASLNILFTATLSIVVFDAFVGASFAAGNSIDPEDLFGKFYWLLVLVGFVSAFLMWKTIEFTSEITGGVATDMSQSFNAAANAANAGLKSLSMIQKGISKGGSLAWDKFRS